MIIQENNKETFTYKGKVYRYGELSLNFLNYKNKKIEYNNQDISFKNDFNKKYSGDTFDKIKLFMKVYTNLIGKFGIEKKEYILNNKKFSKLLKQPYYIYVCNNIIKNNTLLEFKRFVDFLIYDFYNFYCNNMVISGCLNCGSLFVSKTWGGKAYCSNMCRMKYSNAISQQKILENPTIAEYYKIRKRYYMRINRNPQKYSEEIFLDWNKKALKLKKECRSDQNKYYGFEEFLKVDPFKNK